MTTDAQRCPEITIFGMASGVSAFTGEPFVQIVFTFADGSVKAVAQMTPAQARDHALHLLQAAEAAVHDAAMAAWLRDRMSLEPDAAAAAVADIRDYREDKP